VEEVTAQPATTAHAAETDPREAGQQIEELLSGLSGHPDSSVGQAAEELARLLMGMYGAGLERIVALMAGGGEPGHHMLAELVADDLVASLLVLHDLHPEDTVSRVTRALESVRPYLGSHAGDVELLGVEAEAEGPVVRLALKGSCDGCPSSAVTVTTAIEKAIEEMCPEIVRVDVEGLAKKDAPSAQELPLLQIGPRPPEPEMPVSWVVLDLPELRRGEYTRHEVAGFAVLLARPAGAHDADANDLVVYKDQCPSCQASLASAVLAGNELTCAGCSAVYDVRRAGRAVDGSARHLEPLPLVQRAGGWRMAIPRPPVGAAS